MSIVSRPSTQVYRDNFDTIFNKPRHLCAHEWQPDMLNGETRCAKCGLVVEVEEEPSEETQ
jgi:hypothetical protein